MNEERCIGDLGSTPGPWFIAVGGIHGNEPAGVTALEQVFAELKELQVPITGRFIAFRGNLSALAQKQRYLDEDLNRLWTEPQIESLRISAEKQEDLKSVEQYEQRELLGLIEELLQAAPDSVSFVDLHTMSGAGNVFAAFGDTPINRDLASAFPIEQVLNIGQYIKGSMLGYFCQRGYASLGFEAGQHEDPGSVQRHRALIYLALDQLGIIKLDNIASLDRAALRRDLSDQLDSPRLLTVVYRHAIEAGDQFQMEDGWANFMAVKEGEQLATDCRGAVRAPFNSYMLLPLYQGQGSDGFFLVQEL